jgi:hypothetical protein
MDQVRLQARAHIGDNVSSKCISIKSRSSKYKLSPNKFGSQSSNNEIIPNESLKFSLKAITIQANSLNSQSPIKLKSMDKENSGSSPMQ